MGQEGGEKTRLKTGCSVKQTSSVDRELKLKSPDMRCRAAIGSPVIPTPCCYHNYSDVGLTKMCASAFPRGDCVQPRPSFTVASSKVTLSRCGWTMFTSSWCCEQNVFNLWIKSLFLLALSLSTPISTQYSE
jgi:hypothetical protein